ncbi:MAG: TolC family protein [Candidatus Riflebacteria bacterium]
MKKIINALLITAIFLIGNTSLLAGTKTAETKDDTASPTSEISDLKLDYVLAQALAANRTIKKAEFAIKKAEGKVAEARSIAGLKLSGNLTQTRIDDVPTADFGGQKMKLGLLDNQKVWLELAQPLFLGQKDRAAIRSSRLGRQIAKHAFNLVRQQILLAASISYYSWLYAREVEEVGRQNLELAQAHFDLVSKRFKAEQASKYELLRADVRLVQSRSAYLKDQNDAQLSRLELLKLLSMPLDAKLNTTERLEAETLTPNLDEDLIAAEKEREDLKIKRCEMELAEQSMKAARGEKQATVSLFGQYGSEDPSSKSSFGALERKSYWIAGVSVNVPIIDAGNSSGKIAQADSERMQSKNDYSDSLEQMQLEIRQATLTLSTSEQIVKAQKENLKQAEETLRLAKVRYENGMFTQVDLFDAENAWSNASLLYFQSVFQHHQARLSYLLATGRFGRNLIATEVKGATNEK